MADVKDLRSRASNELRMRWIAIILVVAAVAFLALVVFGILTSSWIEAYVGLGATCLCCFFAGRLSKRPDRPTARQTKKMLGLAGDTLTFMQEGLDEKSAAEVCNLLLPLTDASSVAIYDEETTVLGHAGCDSIWARHGDPVRIPAARQRFEYGGQFVIRAEALEEQPFPTSLKACIIAPLKIQDKIVGALKLYYTKHRHIDETQQAIAVGFASLLSTQLALSELEAKTELATKMELRALQAQINPHFLFNTINTIAALIRTDPRQARILLREFAIFYRRTLESSQDLITIELELTQTLRYLGFERARFGAERILLTNFVEPGLEKLEVPAFIIQPIVENAVGHAMRDGGEPLHIHIDVRRSGDDVVISVADDGVGMESTERETAVKKGSSKGAGIALKNVDDRLRSCFGEGSGIGIESTLGVGTTVSLTLKNASVGLPEPEVEMPIETREAPTAEPEERREESDTEEPEGGSLDLDAMVLEVLGDSGRSMEEGGIS